MTDRRRRVRSDPLDPDSARRVAGHRRPRDRWPADVQRPVRARPPAGASGCAIGWRRPPRSRPRRCTPAPIRGRSRPLRSSRPCSASRSIVDAGFGEHDPGPDCDGLSFSAFVERYGMPDWETDPHAVTFPGGETVAEFHFRVGATLSRVVREHAGGAIVVACHGGVVDAAFRALLRLPAHGGFELHTTQHVADRVRDDAARSLAVGALQRRRSSRRPPDRDASRLVRMIRGASMQWRHQVARHRWWHGRLRRRLAPVGGHEQRGRAARGRA